jgi:hypothetical protein
VVERPREGGSRSGDVLWEAQRVPQAQELVY